jgi:hypothetical protein
MVYSPRDEREVNVIFDLLQAAYRYADGCLPEIQVASEERWQKQTQQV